MVDSNECCLPIRAIIKLIKTKSMTKKLIIALLLAIMVIAIANMLIVEYKWFKKQDMSIEYPTVNITYKLYPTKTAYREISMYNAGDPNQTDSTPCISANGENVCTALALGYNRCASNEFDFGTRLEIKGLGECIVTDRMNSRYKTNVDWALTADQRQKALQFGRQSLLVTVK